MTGIDRNFRNVFVDTSAFFALISTRDANHKTALSIQKKLIDARSSLCTTNFVLAETHALVLSRISRATAFQVIETIGQSSVTVLRVTLADEEKARKIIEKYDDKNFSLTDAMSFAVMERLQIQSAFSFDRNFNQYGFSLL